MPMHDWSRVLPGTYHNFHYRWIAAIMDKLNGGVLPRDCFAMAEQVVADPERASGGLALAAPTAPPAETRALPRASIIMRAEDDVYARKANRVVVRHALGQVLAVIELISPGNKNSVHATRALVDKLLDLLLAGIHLVVVDPLPPGPRDPRGLHALPWSELSDEPFALPPGKPLTAASYQASPVKTAYVEPMAVGEPLPTLPLFLRGDYYVPLPLEAGYQETWRVLPAELRRLVE